VSKTTRRIVFFVCAVTWATVFSVFAFEWPADGGRFRYGFGSYRGGFLRGVEFGTAEGLIRAADDGELTFASDGPRLPGGYPIHGGSLLVVSHASDMLTIYSGMESGSSSVYLKNIRKGDALGKGGEAGSKRGTGFYAFDARERRYINPMIVMPSLSDDKAPVIRSVSLSVDSVDDMLEQGKVVRQGSYYVIIDASDASPVGLQSAPFELRILIDGSERGRVRYDAAWANEGQSLLFGGSGIDEDFFLTLDGRAKFGPYLLSRGRVVLSVIALDYSGNKREQSYSISVQ
jgi:hypothetical protein